MFVKREEALGGTIMGVEVLAEETTKDMHRLSADLQVEVRKPTDIGYFFLNVVTKQHYVEMHDRQTQEEIDHPELFFMGNLDERPEPFVVNDLTVDDSIIDKKILRRTVTEDLLPSLHEIEG